MIFILISTILCFFSIYKTGHLHGAMGLLLASCLVAIGEWVALRRRG